MNRQEVFWYPYGEFLDLLACLSIYEGTAKPKKKREYMDFTEFMKLK